MKKRLFSLLVCLALLVTPALAVVDRPANGYVGDYAQVLDDDLEQEIVQRDEALFQRTGAQIVIVSVRFMDGLDGESYAYECFEQWGVGSEELDNGLLLVFATGDYTDDGLKKCWLMVGSGLEDVLSDATLNGWMEDHFYGDFDADDYDAAVSGFFDAACAWLENYYADSGADAAPDYVPAPTHPQETSGSGAMGLVGALAVFTAFIFIAVVVLIALGSTVRRGFHHYYDPWYGYYRPWPIFFWRRRRYGPPPGPPPHTPGPPPGMGGGIGFDGGFHTGGHTRGGGVGRRGGGFSTGHSSFRSGGGGFRSGGGGFHSGGHTRGGGVGRR